MNSIIHRIGEQCADIRRSQQADERVLGDSPRREVTGLRFDWEPLALSEPNLVIFSAEVHYQDERARVRFGIDLKLLQTPELEELHRILSTRHAGLDNRQSLLRSIEWMLTISLGQVEPSLALEERKERARQLL
jgi:hypothetical protein